MGTRKPKPEPEKPHHPFRNPNRVWFELEPPKADTPEERQKIGDARCELANNLLQRIDPGTEYRFFYSAPKCMYAYGHRHGSYRYLSDNGEWMNLDYMGRPLTQTADEWQAAAYAESKPT
jgi:hypothetical protein